MATTNKYNIDLSKLQEQWDESEKNFKKTDDGVTVDLGDAKYTLKDAASVTITLKSKDDDTVTLGTLTATPSADGKTFASLAFVEDDSLKNVAQEFAFTGSDVVKSVTATGDDTTAADKLDTFTGLAPGATVDYFASWTDTKGGIHNADGTTKNPDGTTTDKNGVIYNSDKTIVDITSASDGATVALEAGKKETI